nr:MAG TPA: replicative helicase [Caudoviricetes sp.]
MLYNSNLSSLLLGCLMNNTQLLYNPSYPLAKTDFDPEPVHRIIFIATCKLAEAGAGNVSEVEIDNYVKDYPAQYETLNDSNFLDFVPTVKELCSPESFELYYTTLRKFSLLRELKEDGYNIADYYDEMLDETEQMAKLNKWTIGEILTDIEFKSAKLRTKYDVKYVRNEIKAGENVAERLEAFKEQPSFGALFQSGYLSTIWNGWCRGHLILRGAAAGTGKSRMGVADLVQVGIKEIWNDEAKCFVVNENYQSPTLFVATEQDIETEVEPMFWAAVSGVEYRSIINGLCTHDEEARIIQAGEIIKDSNLHITSMPNFNTKSLNRKIKEMVECEGIGYCVFDYMEQQGDISQEYREVVGSAGRQDQVLLYLATELKVMAEDMNVGILTSQQLNDNWKQMSFVDETALAGGKSTRNKIDAGSIVIATSHLRKDLKQVEPYLKRCGVSDNRQPMPNICEFIIKSRYGIYGDKRLKLWSYFDRGTFQRTDYFVTDDENNVLDDIQPSELGDF